MQGNLGLETGRLAIPWSLRNGCVMCPTAIGMDDRGRARR